MVDDDVYPGEIISRENNSDSITGVYIIPGC